MRSSVRRAVDGLSKEDKSAVEKLVGRRLNDDEVFTLRVYRPHPEPVGTDRAIAATRLKEARDRIAAKAASVPADQLESLIDDACQEVRRRRG